MCESGRINSVLRLMGDSFLFFNSKKYSSFAKAAEAKGPDRLTIPQHERKHGGIDKAWWNGLKNLVDPFEGEWCSDECASLAATLANAAAVRYRYEAAVQNAQMDVDAYGAIAPYGEKAKQRLTAAQKKLKNSTKAYDDAEAKWKAANCSKTK